MANKYVSQYTGEKIEELLTQINDGTVKAVDQTARDAAAQNTKTLEVHENRLDAMNTALHQKAAKIYVDKRVDTKQDKLVAGENITIDPNTNIISSTGGGGTGSGVEMNVPGENAQPITNMKVDGIIYGNEPLTFEVSDVEDPNAIPARYLKINNDNYLFANDIVYSPNKTAYRITVDDNGNLKAVKVV